MVNNFLNNSQQETSSTLTELEKLQGLAKTMANSLYKVLESIGQLESENKSSHKNQLVLNIPSGNTKNHTTYEYTTIDPNTCQKKHITIIEELIVNSPSNHSDSSNAFPVQQNCGLNCTSEPNTSQNRILASAYGARIVKLNADLLNQLEVEQICGQMVAVKVTPAELFDGKNLSDFISPGDTVLEVNGISVVNKSQIYNNVGEVQLKLVLSDIYSAPMEFRKVLDDYACSEEAGNKEGRRLLPYLSFDLRRGDVLQVLSKDTTHIQARKVNDLSQSGFVPINIRTKDVAMLSPYGRRVLVLIGANGVGRRTLKRMLLAEEPCRFSTVVPFTSRAPKPSEQHGRDYMFETKGEILTKIRDGKMLEWGELNGVLYGTSIESVREVVRSGRMCVLDINPKAMKDLYNAEFMPLVVAIASPPFDELQQLQKSQLLEENTKTEEKLREIVDRSDQFLKSEYNKYFDLVIVNRNRKVSLKKLLDTLENMRIESQWVPVEWLCGR